MMAKRDIQSACAGLCTALTQAPCPVTIVSNEVGQGITPDNAMARAFVKHQGHLNQDLARLAQEVIFVTAGIAQTLKAAPLAIGFGSGTARPMRKISPGGATCRPIFLTARSSTA